MDKENRKKHLNAGEVPNVFSTVSSIFESTSDGDDKAVSISTEKKISQKLSSIKFKKLSSKKDSSIISYWSTQTKKSIVIEIDISITLSAAIVPKVFPMGILLYSLRTVALKISPDLGIAILDV